MTRQFKQLIIRGWGAQGVHSSWRYVLPQRISEIGRAPLTEYHVCTRSFYRSCQCKRHLFLANELVAFPVPVYVNQYTGSGVRNTISRQAQDAGSAEREMVFNAGERREKTGVRMRPFPNGKKYKAMPCPAPGEGRRRAGVEISCRNSTVRGIFWVPRDRCAAKEVRSNGFNQGWHICTL